MKPKVLIVDDQFGIRMLLNEVFKKEGYETFQATNGIQALEIIKKEHPDLAVLDMKMPGMDGIEILKRVREFDDKLKVLFMTAFGEIEILEQAKALGAIRHFAKPFDIDEMKIAVKEELSINSKK